MLSRMLSDENDNISIADTVADDRQTHKFLRARHLASLEKCKSARCKVKDDMNMRRIGVI